MSVQYRSTRHPESCTPETYLPYGFESVLRIDLMRGFVMNASWQCSIEGPFIDECEIEIEHLLPYAHDWSEEQLFRVMIGLEDEGVVEWWGDGDRIRFQLSDERIDRFRDDLDHARKRRAEAVLTKIARRTPPKPPRKQRISYSLRNRVFERDGFKFQHCGIMEQLSVDHIIPESRSGTLDMANLQTLCKTCNSRKGNRQ